MTHVSALLPYIAKVVARLFDLDPHMFISRDDQHVYAHIVNWVVILLP